MDGRGIRQEAKKKTDFPAFIMLVGTIIAIIAIFMPFTQYGSNDIRDRHVTVSLADVFRNMAENTPENIETGTKYGAGYVVFYGSAVFDYGIPCALMAISALLAVFVIFKKAGISLVMFMLISGLTYAEMWFLTEYYGIVENGVLDMSIAYTTYGVAPYMFYVASAVGIVGSIWFLIASHEKDKHSDTRSEYKMHK